MKRVGAKSVKALLICMVLAIMMPLSSIPAFAISQEESISGDSLTITYHVGPGEAAPAPSKEFVSEGKTYDLKSVSDPGRDAGFKPEVKTFSRETTIDVAIDDMGRLGSLFNLSYQIDEGSFFGTIPFAEYGTEEIYERFTRQVDRTYVIDGLPDNDVARLPLKMDFTVSDDAYIGATRTATLDLNDVIYEVAGTSPSGLPNNYRATLNYRGQERYLELHHYRVTAYYRGTIESSETGTVVVATYTQRKEAAPVPVPAPAITQTATTIQETATPLNNATILDILPLLIGALAVIAAGSIIAILFWWRSHRLRIVVLRNEKYKTMLSIKLIKQQDGFVANLPGGFDRKVFYFESYFAVPPKRYAKTPVSIMICHKDAVLYEGHTQDLMPLKEADIINTESMAIDTGGRVYA